eukprot:1980988-Pyramimonas_sp.AAC.1
MATSSLPFLVGGDFNMAPSSVQQGQFPQKLRGQIVATESPTCHGAGGPRVYDYFALSGGLAQAVSSVAKIDAPFHLHAPAE